MKEFLFEERFAKNFQRVSGIALIVENKLYPNKMIQGMTNKLGDGSDDTLNKLAIFGLYRQTPPFKEVGDIGAIKSKEELDELYKTWFDNTVRELIKTNSFLDKKDAAIKYLDAYASNIKSFGNNAAPFNMKKLEKSFIDIVNNNKWLKDDSAGLQSKFNIHKPDGKDVIHEDENIVILAGNSRAKCVMYGDGEKWCISQRDVNMFNTYRITNGATIYFVLQKNEEHPEEKIVILNYNNNQYGIADQTNSGNRSGGPEEARSWKGVEQELPNLRGLQDSFKYNEVSVQEKNYHSMVAQIYKGDDIVNYVRENSKGVVVNGAEVTPVDFFNDYLATAVGTSHLWDGQFDNMWKQRNDKEVDHMIMKYLGTGLPLNEYQFKLIEKG